jgi:hypothetical protein
MFGRSEQASTRITSAHCELLTYAITAAAITFKQAARPSERVILELLAVRKHEQTGTTCRAIAREAASPAPHRSVKHPATI